MTTPVRVIISGLCLTSLAVALIACKQKVSTEQIEADSAALREWNDKCLIMVRELNMDNTEKYVKYTYAEDAIIFPPNSKPVIGYEALVGFYKAYPPMGDFNQVIEEMEVFDNYAYLRLNWSIPVKQPDVKPYIDSGIIFCVMRRQNDGNWKIWREIWNSDISVTDKLSSEP